MIILYIYYMIYIIMYDYIIYIYYIKQLKLHFLLHSVTLCGSKCNFNCLYSSMSEILSTLFTLNFSF